MHTNTHTRIDEAIIPEIAAITGLRRRRALVRKAIIEAIVRHRHAKSRVPVRP